MDEWVDHWVEVKLDKKKFVGILRNNTGGYTLEIGYVRKRTSAIKTLTVFTSDQVRLLR